jgi:hypothetical protein
MSVSYYITQSNPVEPKVVVFHISQFPYYSIIQGTLVRLAITAPNFPKSEGLKLNGDSETVEILRPFQKDVENVILYL